MLIGNSRGVTVAPWLGTRSVEQSTFLEKGELLASTSSPVYSSAVNLSGTASPASTSFSAPYGCVTGLWKPRRQSGCVSNASLLSSRFVVPCTALNPRPRRANDAQTVQVSSPSLSRSAEAMIASRATTSPGPQPCILRPSITYWMARLLPPVSHVPYAFGLNPCLSTRSQAMSQRVAAHPWPSPCGSTSEVPSSQPFVLMLS